MHMQICLQANPNHMRLSKFSEIHLTNVKVHVCPTLLKAKPV